MTKQEMLNTIQKDYYRATKIAETIYQEWLNENKKQKAKQLWEERNKWLYVIFELRDLLKKFGIEVVA